MLPLQRQLRLLWRGGQNVRLASELTGWEINVMTEDAIEKQNKKRPLIELYEQPDIDEDLHFCGRGFTTEEIAYVPMEEMPRLMAR